MSGGDRVLMRGLLFSVTPTDPTTFIAVPVLLVVSADSHDFFAEVAGRLSKRLRADVVTTPGRHGAYHDRPTELAETIRPFLRGVSRS